MAAELLGDGLDLAGRDALDVHLGERGHERLFGALVALEQLGGEAAIPVLRHAQLELADPGDEGAAVIARAIAQARCGALTLLGLEDVGHLGFEDLLHDGAHDLAQPVRVVAQKVLDGGSSRFILGGGHGGAPLGVRDVEHHHPAMTARSGDLQNLHHTTGATAIAHRKGNVRLPLAGIVAVTWARPNEPR